MRWFDVKDNNNMRREFLRGTLQAPQLQLVPHVGYVSLFPFMMGTIPPVCSLLPCVYRLSGFLISILINNHIWLLRNHGFLRSSSIWYLTHLYCGQIMAFDHFLEQGKRSIILSMPSPPIPPPQPPRPFSQKHKFWISEAYMILFSCLMNVMGFNVVRWNCQSWFMLPMPYYCSSRWFI